MIVWVEEGLEMVWVVVVGLDSVVVGGWPLMEGWC